ncbi:hypothetical protein [Rhodococcus sp. IEGM 1330]|nr:hypothetical protein [Rhodococcus sp. IEGM 1330]MDV8021451.1 hypothetical protein [Rhodococcus sp. IEGM 1330]
MDADPVPPEVDELKADPRVEWPDDWPMPIAESDAGAQPYRILWE